MWYFLYGWLLCVWAVGELFGYEMRQSLTRDEVECDRRSGHKMFDENQAP